MGEKKQQGRLLRHISHKLGHSTASQRMLQPDKRPSLQAPRKGTVASALFGPDLHAS